MKLYYASGACSFASHMILKELNLPCELIKVDLATHSFGNGEDFYAINPKGFVPTLVLDDGKVLTETAAVMQYLADLKPESGLTPKADSFARYELQAWLNFLSSEVHKSYTPFFFTESTADIYLNFCRRNLLKYYSLIDRLLSQQAYLLGEDFTIADALLYVTLGWSQLAGLNLAPLKHLTAFSEKVGSRPSVKAARTAEMK